MYGRNGGDDTPLDLIISNSEPIENYKYKFKFRLTGGNGFQILAGDDMLVSMIEGLDG